MRHALLIVWVSLLCLSSAVAVDDLQHVGPFTCAVRSLLPQVRPGGPCWIEVSLAADDRLRTGRLSLEVRDGQQVVGRLTTNEWTLSGSLRREVVVLPPLAIDRYRGELRIHVSWSDDQGTTGLGDHPLAIAGMATRQPLVGLAGDGTIDEHLPWQRLVLDRCAPPEATAGRTVLRTTVARLAAADLPDRPLAYAALDALILSQGAVAALKPEQATAIATWVRGGGMLALMVASVPTMSFPGLAWHAPVVDGHRREMVGLGRVVVAPRDASEDGIAWRTSSAFLWRVRGDRAATLIATGHWSAKDMMAAAGREWLPGGAEAKHPGFHSGGDPTMAAQLTRLLWPESMHIVPLPVIIGIFVVFVLLVGPVDWWLLGLIRRRRWTWVTFPLTALAVTAFTVGLSRHYLGSHDERRVLEIIDLDGTGQAVRRNRIELHIAGESSDLALELEEELVGITAGDHQRLRRGPYQDDRQETAEAGCPSLSGSVTGRSRSDIHLAQWSPTLVRRLHLGGTAPAFPWPASVAGWSVDDIAALARDGVWVGLFQGQQVLAHGLPAVSAEALDPQAMRQWMHVLSCCADKGWSSLVAGEAPLGGFPFDDLPLLDTSDGHAALLVVMRRTADGFQMLRRPYGTAAPVDDAAKKEATP